MLKSGVLSFDLFSGPCQSFQVHEDLNGPCWRQLDQDPGLGHPLDWQHVFRPRTGPLAAFSEDKVKESWRPLNFEKRSSFKEEKEFYIVKKGNTNVTNLMKYVYYSSCK